MKTILVHHRSPHHAQHSGYGRLTDYLDAHVVIGSSRVPYRVAKFIGDRCRQDAGLYDSSSVYKEVELYTMLKQSRTPTIVHYLNAERDIRYLAKYYKQRDVKLVGTFHKPPEVLQKTISHTAYLKHLDAAICVGNNQVEFIKHWLNLKQVAYIPHGVDTDFFVPDYTKKSKQPHILFVGQHLRDFDTFNYCMPKIIEHIPETTVSVVLNKAYASRIIPHKSIQVFTGVNDIELRSFYQTAQVLVLPLKDATACNSLLEAMACGLPVVTTDVGGVSHYLAGTENILCQPNEGDRYIDATVALLKDKGKLKRLGVLSREKALAFGWEAISYEINTFYKEVLG